MGLFGKDKREVRKLKEGSRFRTGTKDYYLSVNKPMDAVPITAEQIAQIQNEYALRMIREVGQARLNVLKEIKPLPLKEGDIVTINGEAQMAPDYITQDPNKKPIQRKPIEAATFTIENFDQILNLKLKGKQHEDYLELKKEYTGVQELLVGTNIQDTVINTPRIRDLTKDLYSRGLVFLNQAWDISSQLSNTDINILRKENEELNRNLLDQDKDSTLYSLIAERLDKNNKALKLVKGCNEKLDELDARIGLCTDSIREIRLELPELLNNKSQDETDKVMMELKLRVDYAARVQAEYKRQGL